MSGSEDSERTDHDRRYMVAVNVLPVVSEVTVQTRNETKWTVTTAQNERQREKRSDEKARENQKDLSYRQSISKFNGYHTFFL